MISNVKDRSKEQNSSVDEFVTLDDLCDWLKLKKDYVYALTSQRAIPHLKNGRHLRFSRQEILEWLEQQKQPVYDFTLN